MMFGATEAQTESAEVGEVNEASLKQVVASVAEPLVLLAGDGELDLVKASLLSGRSSVNEQDTNGYSPLMAAASYGHENVVAYLLSCEGIDVNLVDGEGDSALHYCTDLECMKKLVAAGGNTALKNNAGLTPLEHMEQELEEDEDMDSSEEDSLKAVVEFLKSLQQ